MSYRKDDDLIRKAKDMIHCSLEYTRRLLKSVGTEILQSEKGGLIELYERIRELLDTDHIREIRSKDDEDARFGHKNVNSTFFGYKSHLAMTEERIMTGVEVTHGGEPDGKHLSALLEKTKENGVQVNEIIGDMAYVSEDNHDICEENKVTLFARTNAAVAAAAAMPLDEGFSFNKDAGLLQCPAGVLAMRVEKRAAKNGNTYLKYVFSLKKCRKCALCEQCRVGKSKSKERY